MAKKLLLFFKKPDCLNLEENLLDDVVKLLATLKLMPNYSEKKQNGIFQFELRNVEQYCLDPFIRTRIELM